MKETKLKKWKYSMYVGKLSIVKVSVCLSSNYRLNEYQLKYHVMGTGKMVQGLKALSIFPEDQGLIFSTHIVANKP